MKRDSSERLLELLDDFPEVVELMLLPVSLRFRYPKGLGMGDSARFRYSSEPVHAELMFELKELMPELMRSRVGVGGSDGD
jgi:hypothetical protein